MSDTDVTGQILCAGRLIRNTLLIVFFLASCVRQPATPVNPPPPPSPPITSPGCTSACNHLIDAGCDLWGTDAGTCSENCANLISGLPDGTIDLSCLSQIPCTSTNSCFH